MDKNSFPIKAQDFVNYLSKADRWLNRVVWKPKPGILNDAEVDSGAPKFIRTDFSDTPEYNFSLIKFAQDMSQHKILFSDEIQFLLTRLRKAIALGIHMNVLYTKNSGLDTLSNQKNTPGGLSDAQITEFRDKLRTSSMISVYTLARYMCYELGQYRSDELDGISLRFDGIPEIESRNINQALDCQIFYLCMYLIESKRVKSGLEAIKMALLYFRAFLEDSSLQAESLKYVEPFTSNCYQLDGSDFELNGFNGNIDGPAISIEFNRISFDDIVGNKEAKHKARRLALRLCCYDPLSRKNPMMVLGALPRLRSGFGDPGTGKGMQISATATLLNELVPELVGIPFLFHPMPQSMVDSYQGNSGKKMHDWLKLFRDPTRIVYGPIDDAEQNLTDRSRKDCSAGQLELVQEFLPGVEGPTAIWHGNAVMEVFSNLPEKLDPAVLSRIQDRFELRGAISWEDFIDMDYLWLKRYEKIDPEFAKELVAMSDPQGYRYLDAQKLLGSLSELEQIQDPENEDLLKIFHQVEKEYQVSERMYFAKLYELIKIKWPSFSPRDQRNIQNAVNERVYDFDFPDEWSEDPSLFFRANAEDNFQHKMLMIGELAKENMGRYSFAEVWRQEVIRYLDTWLLIEERGRERAIAELVEDYSRSEEARKRLNKNQ